MSPKKESKKACFIVTYPTNEEGFCMAPCHARERINDLEHEVRRLKDRIKPFEVEEHEMKERIRRNISNQSMG